MKIKEIQIPIYKGILAFCISNNTEKVIKYFNLSKILDEKEVFYASSFRTKKDYKDKNIEVYLIVLNLNHFIPVTYGCLVHEINHIGNMIFQQRDITVNYNNDEPEAYLKEWIADELFKFLEEEKLFKKIKFGHKIL